MPNFGVPDAMTDCFFSISISIPIFSLLFSSHHINIFTNKYYQHVFSRQVCDIFWLLHFLDPKFFGSSFFGSSIFWILIFWILIFWKLNFLDPPFFGSSIFSLLHFLAPPFFGSSIFLKLFFLDYPFFGSSIFWILHLLNPPSFVSSPKETAKGEYNGYNGLFPHQPLKQKKESKQTPNPGPPRRNIFLTRQVRAGDSRRQSVCGHFLDPPFLDPLRKPQGKENAHIFIT